MKIEKVFLRPISESQKPKVNEFGIKCQSIVIPKKRCEINEWFNKFSI